MVPEIKKISTRIGLALVVPIPYFLDHVLPPLHPEIELDTVLKKLKRYGKKNQRAITRSGRWWGFAQDPEVSDRCNETAFIHFPKIVAAIAKCGAPKSVKPSLEMIRNPHPGTQSDDRDEHTLPDAFMVARETSTTQPQWEDIDVVGEYDKGTWGRLDNVTRVCCSLNRMFEDPRRRFAFGYTIENTDMRLWFCDRTQIIVSEFFNFITDHTTMTHVFLSLLYAEPHQLGRDPSICLVQSPEFGTQYEFTTTDADGSTSVYRSLELISGGRANTIHHGGTRVWKVVQIIDGVPVGPPAVLKDTWINEELEREGTTLDKIRRSDNSEEFQATFSQNFLTVLCHGDVFVHSRRGPSYCDRTRHHWRNYKAYRRGNPLPDPSLFVPRSRPPPPPTTFTNSVLTGCKVHYRAVFKEVCRPLQPSMALADIYATLAQVCEALKLLHRAGWVHRDVSYGNIMLDESGHVRLTDLEYSKKMGDENIPELRVGTTPFVASEVVSQTYWCGPPPSPNKLLLFGKSMLAPDHEADDDSSELPPREGQAAHPDKSHTMTIFDKAMEVRRRMMELPDTPPPSPPRPRPSHSPDPFHYDNGFRYNPLHDLESVFWIATYVLFTTAGSDQEAEQAEQLEEARKRLLYDEFEHCRAIRLQGPFEHAVSLLDSTIQDIGFYLEDWRSNLMAKYYAAEEDCSAITSSVGAGLYDTLANTLRVMATLVPVARVSAHDSQDSRTMSPKRLREDDVVGTYDSIASPRPLKRARMATPTR